MEAMAASHAKCSSCGLRNFGTEPACRRCNCPLVLGATAAVSSLPPPGPYSSARPPPHFATGAVARPSYAPLGAPALRLGATAQTRTPPPTRTSAKVVGLIV